MKKLKIKIFFDDGKVITEVQKGTSLAELIIASFELHKKAEMLSAEKYVKVNE